MDSTESPVFVSSQPLAEIKQDIHQFNSELIDQFKQDVPVEALVEDRSDFIDRLLTTCWNDFIGTDSSGLSLIATGGYGRAELHPFSDIDLLILFEGDALDKNQSALEHFTTFLWDIGLKPGQSVRNIDDCIEQSNNDISVITNLMESRLITGSEKLFSQMLVDIAPEKIWPSIDFFKEKVAEQQQRHLKFGDTAYNLEPNIKEGPGGLRDIQTIQWITQRYFGSNSLGELVTHAFITKNEYRSLIKGQTFLWKVRFALHVLANRPENRLLFDYQKDIAVMLGYEDGKNNLAVETFMQQYYRTVVELERINELILQVFYEAMENTVPDVYPINEYFRVVNGSIEIIDPDTFKNHPIALLDLFLQLQKIDSIDGIRATTIRKIREDLHLIDDDFRNNPEAQQLFMEIIRHPHGITHQFRRMNRYGILGSYIPAFEDIIGRMQYDLFHIYTVDQHTLFLVRNLRRFALDKHKEELPYCYELFKTLPKPELIYLAGLFHDIAKGRGGNHAKLGKVDAVEFCEKHHVNPYDTALVGWVVENHLLMSMTAQRKDIEDPDVIHEFARKVGSQDYLDYLYLLTVADIRATNPNLWNSWKGSLLQELHLNTQRALRRGLDSPVENEDRIDSMQHLAKIKLQEHGLSAEKVNKIWRNIDKDYFLRFSVEDSVWHTLAISSCTEEELPLVLLRPQTKRGGAEIFIYVKDKRGTFAICTATLDQLGLNILDARIISTANDIALISLHVLENNGDPIADLGREQFIADTVRKNILAPEKAVINIGRRADRQIKHFDIKTTVSFKKDNKKRYTIMEIITQDRPGVLFIIGECFSQCKINVRNAKIATVGSQAEDIFFITDNDDNMITDQALLKKLKKLLLEKFAEM